jgi:hypothetical protein
MQSGKPEKSGGIGGNLPLGELSHWNFAGSPVSCGRDDALFLFS